MKRFLLLSLIFLIIATACNNNKKADSSAVNEDSTTIESPDAEKMQNAAEDMEKKKEELSKLKPLTMDELKALLPETLMGTARTSFDVNSSMGAGLATAEYTLTDSTSVSLSIYDCAGSAGAGIYSLQFLGMMNMQQESDDEYTKTVEFNGANAFEHCDKTSNDCTFTYFAGGRYLVTLEGDNVGAETLKQAARALNIK
ncbi:MAG: hypothetical protein KAY50_04900 [Chitinophagaceae bacterium]|nr:hypothetical protein [Chitinophagaceae bacterium]